MNNFFNNFINLGGGLFLGLLIFIAIFIPAVVIHEFGHLIMGRLVGIKIPEFGVGMPFTKRTFYIKKFGIIWSFYPLLLGGFVRSYGDNDAIDNAYFDVKETPNDITGVKANFRKAKLDEILMNRELQFFLADQKLDYDDSWKQFENVYFNKKLSSEDVELIKSKQKIINTLIDWEFENEVDGKKKDTFFSKNWLQQTLFILGGVTFNIITAIICYTILFTSFYVPRGQANEPISIDFINQVGSHVNFSSKSDYFKFAVVPDNLAAQNGITKDTKIYEIGGKKATEITTFENIREIISQNRGKILNIKVEENGQRTEKNFKLDDKLGVAGAYVDAKFTSNSKNVIDDLGVGLSTTVDFVGKNFNEFKKLGVGIGQKLTGQKVDDKVFENVSSPVKSSNIILTFFQENKNDWPELYLTFLAAISIALAVFNVLPIPALDGGRWLILTLTKLTGHRNRKLEGTLISWTFLALMGLGLFMVGKESIELAGKSFK
jgi:regulator of sigma E protease